MIKFWKSAAKGKSGCPVRPPEPSSGNSSDTIKRILETHIIKGNEDNTHIFEKQSKLTMSLRDILLDMKAVKYFIHFMETIGKHLLIKCWMELENFKTLIILTKTNNENEQHSKISRAKSFDFHCNSSTLKEDKEVVMSQSNSWTNNSDALSSTSNSRRNKYKCSTSSCRNLPEYINSLENNDMYSSNDEVNITEEAISLFKKYVALEAPYQLQLSDDVRKIVISNICQPEGQLNEECFLPVQHTLYSEMESKYFIEFQKSPFYTKAQIDVLTNSSLNLNDILHNETILFYFTEYLEQENCSIFLEFLMAVTHVRDNLLNESDCNSDQAQADAIVLYEKYFSLQATNPIGFPSDIRLKIESDICTEKGPLPTSFDVPYIIVFKTLTKYLKTFLESEIYFKYLSEMIHSVDQMWSSNSKSHSDCSSEFSISTQNTLLAMGDPSFRKKKRNHSVPDMTIDSNQLYNADALWQRKKHDGLILGRVNSLGRFESKFEPDPDKRDKSVLKKMVSKFVPAVTAKVEEEMAWQIAHMIVKDVTDLTMAPPDNDHEYV